MPKPQYHVFLCSQGRPPGHPRGSCQERGCGEVVDEFLFQLQQRNCYDKVAITNTGCIGPCGYGPNVLVYPEGVFYGGVTKADVATIFDEHFTHGMPVERLKVPADVWGLGQMTVMPEADDLCFGHGLPVDIRLLLQQATRAYEDTGRAEGLLMQARKLAPEALDVGIALYKFYFYKYRLPEAEAIALETLIRAAELGGFDADWNYLTAASADWSEPLGPERAYLFTLKALAFISLRLDRLDEANSLLFKLCELDPTDQVGASVIRDLARCLEEPDESAA